MIESNIEVVNRLGLHARAAAQLVKLASEFQSEIQLSKTDESPGADAKSILSILTLAAGRGTVLRVTAQGEDEKIAMEAIVKMFNEGFGEE